MKHSLDGIEGEIYLFDGVGSHQREAYQRVARWNGRRDDWIDKDTFVHQHAGDKQGLLEVAHKEWNDRGGGVTNLASHLAEALEGMVGDSP